MIIRLIPVSLMGLSTMPLSLPAILSVSASIWVLISSKLKYFLSLSSSGKTPYGLAVAILNIKTTISDVDHSEFERSTSDDA